MIHRLRVVLVASLIATTAALCAPAAHAGPASIHAPSLVARTVGTHTVAVDVAFDAGRPCTLLSVESAIAQTMAVSCSTGFRTRSTLDVTTRGEHPEAIDVVDGRAYVVGWSRTRGGTVDSPLLVRTDARLTPDSSFGTAGRATIDSLRPGGAREAWLTDVEVAGDGSVFVAGTTKSGDGTTARRSAFIAKLSPGGSLDPTFGDAGVRVIATGTRNALSSSLRLLGDGSLLLVGSMGPSAASQYRGMAALVDATGTLVPSFGGDGVASHELAPGASSFFQLPRSGATFPMVASASGNDGRGKVRPFLVQLRADGSLVPNWGGYASHRVTTMEGDASALQGMDVDVAPDGAIYAAAETTVLGDWDAFVSRFVASTGRPDPRWAAGGFEPIDANTNHTGSDNEYVMSMSVSPGGIPWAVGGFTRGRRTGMLAFRTIATGSALRQRPGGVVPIDAHGAVLRCGSRASRPCTIRRGETMRVGVVYPGVNVSSPLLWPRLRTWTRTRSGWNLVERSSRAVSSRGRTISRFSFRLPVGTHELEGWRNGSRTLGPGRTNTVFVRVTR